MLVGVARDLVLNPRSLTGGFLYLYQLEDGGESLKLLHKTPVEDVPGAIASFQGRVLIGVGRYLRIYDIGKKKMLRKCENKVGFQHSYRFFINTTCIYRYLSIWNFVHLRFFFTCLHTCIFLEHSKLCVWDSYPWKSYCGIGCSGQFPFCEIQATREPVDSVC